jgi:hypothetical protein
MLPPVILASLDGPAAAKERALAHLRTTHESRKLEGYAEVGRRAGQAQQRSKRGRSQQPQRACATPCVPA